MMITGDNNGAQENKHTIAVTIAMATHDCDQNIEVGTRDKQAVCINLSFLKIVRKILSACEIMETLKNIE